MPLSSQNETSINSTQNIVFAGVGRPVKVLDPPELTLNRASLRAEHSGIIKATYGNQNGGPSTSAKRKKTNMPGAMPKDTISAKESSCSPMALVALRARATKPSKRSKTAATVNRMAAWNNSPLRANTVAAQPQSRFEQLSELGMMDRNAMGLEISDIWGNMNQWIQLTLWARINEVSRLDTTIR